MSQTTTREMGVSEARANMTEVIAEARLLDVDLVLTRRDKPQAVLLSVKRYRQALLDAEVRPFHEDVVRRLKELLGNPEFAQLLERLDPDLCVVLENDML